MTFILENTPEGVNLVVTGDWSSKARDALSSGEADGLDLNYAKGFRERDLRFLEGLSSSSAEHPLSDHEGPDSLCTR